MFLVVASLASASDGPSLPKGHINVGFLKSFPPYYQLDKNGNPSGFAADVMNEVAKRSGLTVNYVVKENWEEIDTAFLAGDIDIIPNYGITAHRKKYAAFTTPVDTLRISIFVRDDTSGVKGIDDLSQRPVAVLAANAAYRILSSRDDFKLQVFDDITKALFALLSAEVDAFVYPESVAWKLAREIRIDGQIKVVGEPLKEIRRGMAVHIENVTLLAILDEAIREFVASPEYRNIYTTWFGKPRPYWSVARVAWVMGGGMIALFMFMGWWRYNSIIKLNSALRESENRYRKIVEGSTELITIVDIDGQLKFANHMAQAIYGLPPEDCIGLAAFDFIHPEDVDRTKEMFQNWIESQESTFGFENRQISRDGTTHDMLWSISARHNDDGKVTGFTSIARDVTISKRTEAALRESQNRLALIFNIAPEAVITIGADMNIQSFNNGAERIFGYNAEEVIGHSMDILMPKHLRQGHGRHIEGFDRSPDTYRLMDQRDEISGLRKDGTEFPASASVSKLEIDGEKVFTVMLHDISERRIAEDGRRKALMEAEKANQAKSEFLAHMSHELRTPLNAIGGFSDMLAGEFFGKLGSPKYKEYADDIRARSNHLLHLINDILDLSAIEAGEMTLNKEDMSVKEIVHDCSRFIIKAVGEKDIRYAVDVPESFPSLRADKRAVKQILINLLSNSVKYTPNEGQVTLSARVSNGHHIFEIRDNGTGVSKEKLQHLTEAFVRGETDPHKAQEGTGLGLAIVKSLVDLHDGELTIESEVGKGTAVTVALPSDIG